MLAVSRGGRSFLSPGPTFQLFPGDRVILSGQPSALDRAIEYLARVDYPDQQEDHEDFAVAEVQVGSLPGWTGRTIAALHLRAGYGDTWLAVAKNHQTIYPPDPHRTLSEHDRVVLAGTREGLERVQAAGVPSPNEPHTMPL